MADLFGLPVRENDELRDDGEVRLISWEEWEHTILHGDPDGDDEPEGVIGPEELTGG